MSEKKLLIAGDIEGNFEFLVNKINQFIKKGQNFDYCICVGRTLKASFDFKSLLKKGDNYFPIPIYFIEGGEMSGVMNTIIPDGKEIMKNLHFLGRSGIKDIHGIKIGYISGKIQHDASQGEVESQYSTFNNGHYTFKDVNKISNQEEILDILLTSEWPDEFDSNIQVSDELRDLKYRSSEVTALARFAKPRYHFVGLENRFYKRPPYLNERSEHITRLIGMGKMPKDETEKTKQQYLFALKIKGIQEMKEDEYKGVTDDSTPNPYLTRNIDTDSQLKSSVHKKVKTEQDEEGKGADKKQAADELKENKALYFFGFDPKTKDSDIYEFLSRWGEIQEYQLLYEPGSKKHKGNGFVQFNSLKVTKTALRESQEFSLYGRKIGFNISNRGTVGGKKKERKTKAECWFCIDNPNVAKDLILSVGENIYTALDKGPLSDHHILIIPIEHYANSVSLPEDHQAELTRIKKSLVQKFDRNHGEAFMFYERYTKLTSNVAHTIINAIPFKAGDFKLFDAGIFNALANSKYRFVELEPKDHILTFIQPGEYFFYIELSNPQFERDNVYIGKRFLIILQEADVKLLPREFGRELYCNILGLKDKLDWKNCQLDETKQKQLTQQLRKIINK